MATLHVLKSLARYSLTSSRQSYFSTRGNSPAKAHSWSCLYSTSARPVRSLPPTGMPGSHKLPTVVPFSLFVSSPSTAILGSSPSPAQLTGLAVEGLLFPSPIVERLHRSAASASRGPPPAPSDNVFPVPRSEVHATKTSSSW